MATSRAQRVRLGIFVGVGLLVLVGGLIVLAGMRMGEVRDSYTIRYADGAVSLSGLEAGSPVKYSGIRVGRVDGIRIDPEDLGVVLVEISLTGGTPVAADSKANLGSQGITGLKYIELTRGTRAAGIRPVGSGIPPGASALDSLSSQAGDIADKVSTTLDRINALVDPAMKQRVATLLDDADALLKTTEATIAENRESLKTVSTNLATASARFDGVGQRLESLLDDAQPHVRRVLRDASKMARNVEGSSGEFKGLITDSRKALNSADRLMQTGTLTLQRSRDDLIDGIRDLREVAENLKDFSRRIREDPSLLLIREDDD